MDIKRSSTKRGFSRLTFFDYSENECIIQESSIAEETALRIGCLHGNPLRLVYGEGWKPIENAEDVQCNTTMHLTREQVKKLLPYLTDFVENGDL